MKKLSLGIKQYISLLGGDESLAKKAHRAAQVRSMWEECVEPVFLNHTNSVYIIKEKEDKILIVYVDESIYAAELNARRELIKLKLLQNFGEDISEFRILISRGAYKKNYPYRNNNKKIPTYQPRKLTEEEKEIISSTSALIDDEKIKKSLEQAMINDWKWKN